jgi:hypothetical protein
LAKLFIGDDVIKNDPTKALRRNKLSQDLTLGYMALISSSDVYNEALNAGYDNTSAGLAGLLTTSALYGIMSYNSTTRGIGTWFLNKSTGFEEGVTRKGFAKEVNKLMIDTANRLKPLIQSGDKKGIRSTLSNFKKDLTRNAYNFINYSENIWKGAVIESIEEVSEEAISDAVKGIMDTVSWLGYTKSQGSFGGFSNVFSETGLQRYLTSLLGGAIGGAMFDFQINKLEPFLSGKPILKENKTLD